MCNMADAANTPVNYRGTRGRGILLGGRSVDRSSPDGGDPFLLILTFINLLFIIIIYFIHSIYCLFFLFSLHFCSPPSASPTFVPHTSSMDPSRTHPWSSIRVCFKETDRRYHLMSQFVILHLQICIYWFFCICLFPHVRFLAQL